MFPRRKDRVRFWFCYVTGKRGKDSIRHTHWRGAGVQNSKVFLERNEEVACESGLGGQGATRRSAPDCSLTASTVTEASFRPEAVTQGVFSLMLVAPSGNLATAPLGFAATAYE